MADADEYDPFADSALGEEEDRDTAPSDGLDGEELPNELVEHEVGAAGQEAPAEGAAATSTGPVKFALGGGVTAAKKKKFEKKLGASWGISDYDEQEARELEEDYDPYDEHDDDLEE
eukprot:SAG31_NODE_20093_length_584_cov_0.616495_1_plen_116_part_10